VAGPISPDVVFLRASRGDFEGVLALYHDQAFIPIKLLSRERGVTVLSGLPYLRVSPVHGTAFDIAGRGQASPENLVAALLQAAAWAPARVRQG
jgi:4-hydroxythreonine-4-phosphate dehydrogenase